ncbi:hypothetical protein JCGZ_00328 [Jatropha curcas]|uniref:Aminotransferase-like plant mobile domain-containing protein n=1 Tax=Jatropha curcas TaxID=180498 RepID=A0A067JUI2_JATCU|nr:hypothetical protein JCGZ_00328 [Jatropha curcas]
MPIWYLKRPKNYEDHGTGPGIVFGGDLSLIGTFDWASLALAHLYHGLDVWTRGSGESNWQFLCPLEVWAYEYQIYLGGPESDTLTEAQWIPRYLVHRHHTNLIAEDPHHWRRYLNDRALADLFLTPGEGDAWTAYAPRVRAEALTRSRVLLQGYWLDRYYLGERVLEIRTTMAQRRVPVSPPRHMCTLDGMTPEDRLLEYGGFPADDYLVPGDYASYLSTQLKTRLLDVREYSQELETGRLRRHQARQAAAVSSLQMESDKLRTRLEVGGFL